MTGDDTIGAMQSIVVLFRRQSQPRDQITSLVCHGVTDGVREVVRDTNVPVAFGVLTTNDVDQALERGALSFETVPVDERLRNVTRCLTSPILHPPIELGLRDDGIANDRHDARSAFRRLVLRPGKPSEKPLTDAS